MKTKEKPIKVTAAHRNVEKKIADFAAQMKYYPSVSTIYLDTKSLKLWREYCKATNRLPEYGRFKVEVAR